MDKTGAASSLWCRDGPGIISLAPNRRHAGGLDRGLQHLFGAAHQVFPGPAPSAPLNLATSAHGPGPRRTVSGLPYPTYPLCLSPPASSPPGPTCTASCLSTPHLLCVSSPSTPHLNPSQPPLLCASPPSSLSSPPPPSPPTLPSSHLLRLPSLLSVSVSASLHSPRSSLLSPSCRQVVAAADGSVSALAPRAGGGRPGRNRHLPGRVPVRGDSEGR